MAKKEHQRKTLQEVAPLYGLGHFRKHLFLCTGPDCCTPEEGMAAWQALKAKIKQRFPRMAEADIYRTKVGCLRMCRQGPIAVCYPEGKWFREVTADQVDALVDYLASGSDTPHPLEFFNHPLPDPAAGD